MESLFVDNDPCLNFCLTTIAGVVLFELLCPFDTEMERLTLIRNLREKGQLPAKFLKEFPKEGALILWLTAASPLNRPTAEVSISPQGPSPLRGFTLRSHPYPQCPEGPLSVDLSHGVLL